MSKRLTAFILAISFLATQSVYASQITKPTLRSKATADAPDAKSKLEGEIAAATITFNGIALSVPVVGNSLRQTVQSLALNPDIVIPQGTPDALKPGDSVTIAYKSPLYFLKTKNNPDGQDFYRDNYPLTENQIRALYLVARMMGITTNLNIFQAAAERGEFDEAIAALVRQGITDPKQVYDITTMNAFAAYANLIGEQTANRGTASDEVPPNYIHDVLNTIRYIREIAELCPGVGMGKVPATTAGFAAIRESGTHHTMARDNVTLMFGFEQWIESQFAQLDKLQTRIFVKKLPVDEYFGVDSFFLSRTNMLFNLIFETLNKQGLLKNGEDKAMFLEIKNLVAIAQAKIVGRWNNYVYFDEPLPEGTPHPKQLDEIKGRFKLLQEAAREKNLGEIRPRVPLWASTSVKIDDIKAGVDELLYFVNLIGPHTVNTMPDGLIDAIEKRFAGLSDAEKEKAMEELARAIDDNRIIVKYDPKGNSVYADEFTPEQIINIANELLGRYTNEILTLASTHPDTKQAQVRIQEEIDNYNAKLGALKDSNELIEEVYEKEILKDEDVERLNLEIIAKLLTWRGGDSFEDAYNKSLNEAFAQRIEAAKTQLAKAPEAGPGSVLPPGWTGGEISAAVRNAEGFLSVDENNKAFDALTKYMYVIRDLKTLLEGGDRDALEAFIEANDPDWELDETLVGAYRTVFARALDITEEEMDEMMISLTDIKVSTRNMDKLIGDEINTFSKGSIITPEGFAAGFGALIPVLATRGPVIIITPQGTNAEETAKYETYRKLVTLVLETLKPEGEVKIETSVEVANAYLNHTKRILDVTLYTSADDRNDYSKGLLGVPPKVIRLDSAYTSARPKLSGQLADFRAAHDEIASKL
ncbi:MAG: transaldolase family protein [Candidatus Omnitrophota bacterium]